MGFARSAKERAGTDKMLSETVGLPVNGAPLTIVLQEHVSQFMGQGKPPALRRHG